MLYLLAKEKKYLSIIMGNVICKVHYTLEVILMNRLRFNDNTSKKNRTLQID